MCFFTSLIVLVPLVFSVVALPASAQDVVSTIIPDINGIEMELTDAADLLQSSTNTNVAAQAQVSQLKFTLRSILPILMPFHV